MEGLLHWDFNPGLAVEDQVRRRFRSMVHFSPRPSSKEFFLVVTFSSASFPLSCSSVALALQCCIGGIASGFNVTHIGDRNFRFSVASNKVGHFIYGLRDRVWPDFICHFSLFKRPWNLPSDGFLGWSANHEITELSMRSPTVIHPNLKFLETSAAKDNSSVHELAKFGFLKQVPGNLMDSFNSVFDEHVPAHIDHQAPLQIICDTTDCSSNSTQEVGMHIPPAAPVLQVDPISSAVSLPNTLLFGSLEIAIFPANHRPTVNTFLGKKHRNHIWRNIPHNVLYSILDLRQATYEEADIKHILELNELPPSEAIHDLLGRCTRCFAIGHLSDKCTAKICPDCRNFERACYCTKQQLGQRIHHCSICNSMAH